MNVDELIELGLKYLSGQSEREKQKGIDYLLRATEKGSADAYKLLFEEKKKAGEALEAGTFFSGYAKAYADNSLEDASESDRTAFFKDVTSFLSEYYDYIANPKTAKRDKLSEVFKAVLQAFPENAEIKLWHAKYCLLNTSDKNIEMAKKLFTECFNSGVQLNDDEQSLIGQTNPFGSEYRKLPNAEALKSFLQSQYPSYKIESITAIKELKSAEMILEILKNDLEQDTKLDKKLVSSILNGSLKPEVYLSYHPILKCKLALSDFTVRYEKKVWAQKEDGSGDWLVESSSTHSFNSPLGVMECALQTKFFDDFNVYSYIKNHEQTDSMPREKDYFYAPNILSLSDLEKNAQKELNALIDEYASKKIAEENDWDFKDIISEPTSDTEKNITAVYDIIFIPLYTFTFLQGKTEYKFLCSGVSDHRGLEISVNGKLKNPSARTNAESNSTSARLNTENEQAQNDAKQKNYSTSSNKENKKDSAEEIRKPPSIISVIIIVLSAIDLLIGINKLWLDITHSDLFAIAGIAGATLLILSTPLVSFIPKKSGKRTALRLFLLLLALSLTAFMVYTTFL